MLCRILIVSALFLAAVPPAQALRFFVDGAPALNDTTPPRGDDRRSIQAAQNPATPFRTIAHALRIAHLVSQGRPHVIDIAPGTYSHSVNGETFPLLITQPEIFIETRSLTTFDAEGRSGFFRLEAPTSDFLIQGITFLNGRAEQGVIYCETCSLRVTNNRFFANRARRDGHVVTVKNGRLEFFNNLVRDSGAPGDSGAVIQLHDVFSDTSQRDIIRNNTFYRSRAPDIRTAGNRTDISSNIFLGSQQPAIFDAAADSDPLVRFNLFWETDILLVSEQGDSIKVQRTVRDTLTLEELGVQVPAFVTNQPDTVAQVGAPYRYEIQVMGNKDFFRFTPLTLPRGTAAGDIVDLGIVNWTPDADQIGRHEIRIEVINPVGELGFLTYNVQVFTPEAFPDTSSSGPRVDVSLVPDTLGAIADLNARIPVFSSAASAQGNLYANPTFLDTSVNRFELPPGSPGRDAGNPIAALRDAVGKTRNDMGLLGGPRNSGLPARVAAADSSFLQLNITSLPDSTATVGRVFTYDPTLDRAARIQLIDLILSELPRPPTMGPFRPFGKAPPIQWTPTLADTGTYLIGVMVFTNLAPPSSQGQHYFPLRVKPANEAPLVRSTPVPEAFEDSLYTYAIDAFDPEGDPVFFSVAGAPEGLVVDSLGVVRWTPAQADVGRAHIAIRLDDGRGASREHRFDVEVFNTNDAPRITSRPDTLAFEDSLYQYAPRAADEDPADTLFSFALLQGPPAMSIDSLGVVRWTPAQADVGPPAQAVRIQVSDAAGASSTQSFVLSVLAVNDAPRITSRPDTLAFEDSLYQYAVQATDEEGDPLSFALDPAPAGAHIDSLGVVRWTPAAADTGRHAFAVQVSDPAGLSARQRFEVLVEARNDAPRIRSHAPADTLLFPEPGTELSFSVEATDEEGDSLAFSWRVNGVLQEGAGQTSFRYTPSTLVRDTLSVRVADSTGAAVFSWIIDARRIPRVAAASDSIAFGGVAIGDTARALIAVRNRGHAQLEISNLQVGDLAFDARFSTAEIAPMASAELRLSFAPQARGTRASFIRFSTNDPDRPTIEISLQGTAVVPTRLSLDLDPAPGDQGLAQASVAAGRSVDLSLYAAGALELSGYDILLAYDPAFVRFARFSPSRENEANLLDRKGLSLHSSALVPADSLVLLSVSLPAGAGGVSGDGFLGLVSFVADSALAGQSTLRLVEASLQSAGQARADMLRPGLTAILEEAPALVGDLDGDQSLTFDDFFLFADTFGKRAGEPGFLPAADLDGDQSVTFDDFFLFADTFGKRAARRLPAANEAAAGLSLQTPSTAPMPDQVEVALHWSGKEALFGYVLALEFDAEKLEFLRFQSRTERPFLPWIIENRPGYLLVAAARGGGEPFRGSDLGELLFARRSDEALFFRATGALGRFSGGTASVSPPASLSVEALPDTYVLYPPYPNPFNPETTVPLFLPRESQVHLRIYDALGRPVRTLAEGRMARGYHTLKWRGLDGAGRPVGAGVYFVLFEAGDARQVRKLLLLK